MCKIAVVGCWKILKISDIVLRFVNILIFFRYLNKQCEFLIRINKQTQGWLQHCSLVYSDKSLANTETIDDYKMNEAKYHANISEIH